MKRTLTTLVITLSILGLAAGADARSFDSSGIEPGINGDKQVKGSLYVIHGIPGLPSEVDVYANGGYVASFDFNESLGPLDLDAGSYYLEVKLAGTTVLSANARISNNGNYTAIAHLDEMGGIKLTMFKNLAPNNSRATLTVRHTAQAPTVDVGLARDDSGLLVIPNFSNGDQIGPVVLPPDSYRASLYAGGAEVFNSGSLDLMAGTSYMVYAIGTFPDTFQLYVQTISNAASN
jgi:hypothetical protein